MAGEGLLEWLFFWKGYEQDLITLTFYAVGLTLYGLFIYSFYTTLNRKDILGVGRRRSRIGGAFLFLMGFPVVTFLFFFVLSLAIFLLAKTGQTVDQILLVSMAVVTGTRITAFISEGAAHELAKMMPLALMGVFLVQPGYLELATATGRFQELLTVEKFQGVVLRYFIFLVLLEMVLRGLHRIVRGAPRPSRSIPRPPTAVEGPPRPPSWPPEQPAQVREAPRPIEDLLDRERRPP